MRRALIATRTPLRLLNDASVLPFSAGVGGPVELDWTGVVPMVVRVSVGESGAWYRWNTAPDGGGVGEGYIPPNFTMDLVLEYVNGEPSHEIGLIGADGVNDLNGSAELYG